jgi:hypothetical protein
MAVGVGGKEVQSQAMTPSLLPLASILSPVRIISILHLFSRAVWSILDCAHRTCTF